MRREDGAGEGGRVEWRGRVEGEDGDSFGGSVARSKDSGSARTVFGPVKDMYSESLERCRDGIERTGSFAGIGVASVQGRPGGRKECIADGGRVPEPRQ